VIKSDSKINKLFEDLGHLLHKSNAYVQSDVYLVDKVSKLKGILNAFNERRSNIKSYVNRCELRQIKHEKLSASTEGSVRFEIQNEIELLNKDLGELKKSIVLQNSNIAKELELLESTRLHQMRKLIGMIGVSNFNCLNKVDEYLQMRVQQIPWMDAEGYQGLRYSQAPGRVQ